MAVHKSIVLSDDFLTSEIICSESEGFQFVGEVTEDAVMYKILREVLFMLPMSSFCAYLPNPKLRFCLNLKQSIPWFRNRKMRQCLSDFTIAIRTHLRDDLEACAVYHEKRDGQEGWLSTPLIEALHNLSLKIAASRRSAATTDDIYKCLQLFSFSLIEKETGRVAASTFGFASGGVFEDYSMCTLIKDKRSCGSVLNKVVGYILQQCGITIWYWGYKVGYMTEYESHYSAGYIPRPAFYEEWQKVKDVELKPFSQVMLPYGLEFSELPSERVDIVSL